MTLAAYAIGWWLFPFTFRTSKNVIICIRIYICITTIRTYVCTYTRVSLYIYILLLLFIYIETTRTHTHTRITRSRKKLKEKKGRTVLNSHNGRPDVFLTSYSTATVVNIKSDEAAMWLAGFCWWSASLKTTNETREFAKCLLKYRVNTVRSEQSGGRQHNNNNNNNSNNNNNNEKLNKKNNSIHTKQRRQRRQRRRWRRWRRRRPGD
jgi:hypothetical protein